MKTWFKQQYASVEPELSPSPNAALSSPEDEWQKTLLDGSQEGFEKLYRHFRTPVLNYAQSRLHDRDAAEEMTQEVFIKVFRFRSSYKPEFPFKGWFWTLVRNTAHDWSRKGKNSFGVDDDVAAETIPCDAPCAESVVVRKSLRKAIWKRLQSLTRLQRKVLWLKLMHELSHEEIANRLGLSIASVKCLMYRTRDALHTMPDLSSLLI